MKPETIKLRPLNVETYRGAHDNSASGRFYCTAFYHIDFVYLIINPFETAFLGLA